MRILDSRNGTSVNKAILYLTNEEAYELRDSLVELTNFEKEEGVHFHISDREYKHEITVCIYDEAMLDFFDTRSQELIKHDK